MITTPYSSGCSTTIKWSPDHCTIFNGKSTILNVYLNESYTIGRWCIVVVLYYPRDVVVDRLLSSATQHDLIYLQLFQIISSMTENFIWIVFNYCSNKLSHQNLRRHDVIMLVDLFPFSRSFSLLEMDIAINKNWHSVSCVWPFGGSD